MAYYRKCPICDTNIFYPEKYLYNRAVRENRKCKSCASKASQEKRKITLFERLCPKCNKKLVYKGYHSWWLSKTKKLMCRSCSKLGKKMPVGFSEKISKIVSGKGNPMYGKHHSKQVKLFISKLNKGNTYGLGYKFSDSSKQKMREAVVKRIKLYGIHSRNFNKNAYDYMDTLNPMYHFQHALNGGEYSVSGYLVDGYDRRKNVVLEYDEPHHYDVNGNLKQKDIDRMSKIKQTIHCKFLRYNELLDEIKEY